MVKGKYKSNSEALRRVNKIIDSGGTIFDVINEFNIKCKKCNGELVEVKDKIGRMRVECKECKTVLLACLGDMING